MESTDARKSKTASQTMKVCKPYVAPDLERLSPAAARNLLLQNADASDPELQQVLDCVDELQGEKGS
jgi:hypothetical protein